MTDPAPETAGPPTGPSAPADPAPPRSRDGEAVAALAPEAVAEAVAERAGLLWTIAAGVLGGGEGAEDVVQDAAITAIERRGTFDAGAADANLVAWLARIVRLTALNHMRRRRTRRARPLEGLGHEEPVGRDAAGGPAGASGSAARAVDASGTLRAGQGAFDDDVAAALGELGHAARTCLLLQVVHDLPLRDVARVTGLPEGTVRSHVTRARGRLRGRLAERGDDPREGRRTG